MKLQATVIATHSASDSADRKPHVTLKVEEAQWTDSKLKLPNTESYALDDELTVLVFTQKQVKDIVWELDDSGAASKGSGYPSVTELADQLRPDPLPPWEADRTDNDATVTLACSVCKHGDPVDETGHCTHVSMSQSDNMDVDVCGHYCVPQPDTADTQEFTREVGR